MTADRNTDVASNFVEDPDSLAEQAYAVWCAEADDVEDRHQPVQLELSAEHHVMGAVLKAMDQEWRRMERGGPLRTPFWADVVDFNGNFVYACHRVKEDELLIPALVKNGGLPQKYVDAVHREHDRAKSLTLGIRDGVEEGDWEKVMRLVAMYVSFLRPHMHHEEVELFGALSSELPEEVQAELRTAFSRIEAEALPTGGRRQYVDVARRLLDLVGAEYAL